MFREPLKLTWLTSLLSTVALTATVVFGSSLLNPQLSTTPTKTLKTTPPSIKILGDLDAKFINQETETQELKPLTTNQILKLLTKNKLQGKQIDKDAIDSDEIKNKSITSSDIKTGQINSRTIEDYSIQSKDLRQNQSLEKLELTKLRVGEGSPSHFTLNNGDVYIQDQLEVDGNVYFDQTLYVRDSSSISTMTSDTLHTETASISNILSNSPLHIQGRLPDSDTFSVHDFTKAFINPALGTIIGRLTTPTFQHIDGNQDLYVEDDLEVGGIIYGTISGAYSPSGDLDMNNHIIENIGNANTDFTSTGGLNLGDSLLITGNITLSGTVDGKDIATNAGMLNEPETITSNWINTANPWSDNEIANNLTIITGNIDSTTTIDKDPVITLANDLSGNVTLLNLNSGILTATITANSVALGIDTTGNYISTITGNSQINVSGSGTESANSSLSINSDSIGDTQLTYNTGQHLTTISTPTFATLTLNGNLTLGSNTLTTSNTNLINNLNADLLDGQHGSYYLTASNIAGTDNYIPRFNGSNALENSVIYDDGGNVGIGTTGPVANLDISDPDEASLSLYDSAGYSNARRFTLINDHDGTSNYFKVQLEQDDGTDIRDIMTMLSSGNVGIGTDSPGSLLHVQDSTNNFLKYIGNGGLELSRSTNSYGASIDFKEDDSLAYRIKIDQDGSNNQNLQFIDASLGYTMTLEQGGNVGIGTDSPSRSLHVESSSDSIALFKSTDDTSIISIADDDTTASLLVKDDLLSLGFSSTQTNNILHIKSDGNVGIGTTSPGALLNLSTTISDTTLRLDTTNASISARNWDISANSLAYGDLDFRQSDLIGGNPRIAGTSRMYIKNNGNIGIGTTSPGSKLHVDGNIRLNGTDDLVYWGTSNYMGVSSAGLNIRIADSGDGDSLRILGTSGAEKVRFTNSGNIGIGTTTPTALTHILQTGSDDAFRIDDVLADTSPFVVDATGQVGIGTASPSGLLHILRLSTADPFPLEVLRLGIDDNSNMVAGMGPEISFELDASGAFVGASISAEKEDDIDSSEATILAFGTTPNTEFTPTERMRITSTGNIGIGTTTPTALTHILQTGSDDAFRIDDVLADTSPFVVDATGQVGIGTDSPGAKLEVEGDMNVTNTNLTLPAPGSSGTSNQVYNNFTLTPSTDYTVAAGGFQFVYGLNNNHLISSATTATDLTRLYLNGQINTITYEADAPTTQIIGLKNQVTTNTASDVNLILGLTNPVLTQGSGNIPTAKSISSVLRHQGSGILTDGSALSVVLKNKIGGGSITNAYGVNVGNLVNSAGSIGSTYGVYVGDITTGTQTNTPYSFYASDASAHNYFAGNIGIGTTSPDSLLNIVGADPILLVKDTETSTSLANSILRLAESTTGGITDNYWDITAGSSVDSDFGFSIGSDDVVNAFVIERLTGNIGIGTASPDTLLHISNDSQNSILRFTNEDTTVGVDYNVGSIEFETFDSHAGIGAKIQGITEDNEGDLGLAFFTTTDAKVSLNERMRITQTGNVGIGTTTPTAQTHILQTGSDDAFRIDDVLADTSPFVVDATGQVGIGTDSPGHTLDVNGTVRFLTDINLANVDAAQGVTFRTSASRDLKIYTNVGVSSKLGLYQSNAGSVGIGTSSPTALTHILQTGSDDAFRIDDVLADTSPFVVDAAGQVGIGTESPGVKLEIYEGDILVHKADGSSGIKLMNDAIGVAPDTAVGVIRMWGYDSNGNTAKYATIKGLVGNSTDGAEEGYLTFSTMATPRMIIKNGNVGIGVTSPNALLHVMMPYGRTDTTERILSLQTSNDADFRAGLETSLIGGVTASDRTAILQAGSYDVSGSSFSNTGEKLALNPNGGNIGIGTTSPGYKLDISSSDAITSRFLGGNSGNSRIMVDALNADANSYITLANNGLSKYSVGRYTVDNSFRIAESNVLDSNTRFVIDDSGNVGIGTTSPGAKLDLRNGTFALSDSDVDHGITIILDTNSYGQLLPLSGTNGGLAIRGASDADAVGMALLGMIGDSDPTDSTSALNFSGAKKSATGLADLGSSETVLKIQNRNTDLVTVLGSGNLGIGTTSPGAGSDSMNTGTKLEIAGTGTSRGLIDLSATVTADESLAGILNFLNSDNSDAGASTRKVVSSIRSTIETTDANAGDDSGGNLLFYTKPEAGIWGERMRITSTGNLGIGTTSPGAALHIIPSGVGVNGLILQNFAGQSADIMQWKSSGGTTTGVIDNNGNIGIGTTSPDSKLQIGSGSGGNLKISGTSDGTVDLNYAGTSRVKLAENSGSAFGTNGVSGYGGIQIGGSGGSAYISANATSLILNPSTGNIGIGTTSPGAKLDVYTSTFTDPTMSVYDGAYRYNFGYGSHTLGNERFSIYKNANIVYINNQATNTPGGSQFRFQINGSDKLTIDNDGNIGIGTTSPNYKLQVAGAIMLEDTTAPTSASGISGIYSNTGELFAIDALGNTTQLSPHDEDNNWFYNSENINTGKTLKVEMEKLTKEIDRILGGGYVFENGEEYNQNTENIITNLVTGIDLLTIETTDNNLEIINNQEELSNLKEDLVLANNQLEELTINIDQLNELNSSMINTLTSHEERIVQLESWIPASAGMTEGEIGKTELSFGELLEENQDEEGNPIFTLTASLELVSLKAEKGEFEKLQLGSQSSGKGIIEAGDKEILVESVEVSSDSKISITADGNSYDKVLYYDEVVDGESFKVKFNGEILEENVEFDWILIQ